MKAGLAAALIAARDAAALGLARDVVVAAVADEEHASTGIQEVLGSVRADAAIVPDAIVQMGPVLVELGLLDRALGGRRHPLLGRGSVHASTIEGGRELSSYPARCVLTVERRTLPGESTADVEREQAELLARCRSADPELAAARRTLLARVPLEVDERHEIVEAVRGAAASVTGTEPPLAGASYWADSGFIAAAGIPTVLYGPRGEGAHALEERVSLRSTAVVAETLLEVAKRFCA